jgi:hypothetical protein
MIYNFKYFLLNENSSFCQNCGFKNPYPTIEEVKSRGWGGVDLCSKCGENRKFYATIDKYDEKTWILFNEFYKNLISNNSSIKIEYDIFKENGKYIFDLKDIVVRKIDSQNKGKGTEVMNKIIDFLDKNNLEARLRASDYYGSNIKKLINFYNKFGFIETGHINNIGHLMIRKNEIF